MKHTDSRVAAASHRDRGEIDAVADVSVGKIVGKLLCRHNCAVVLALLCRRSKVGDRHHAFDVYYVFGGEIGHVCGNLSAFKRFLEICGIDKVSTGEVQNSDAVLHLRNGLFIDHSLCLRGGGYVEGDIVRASVNVVIRSRFGYMVIEIPRCFYRQIRVTSDDVHTKMDRCIRHHSADRAKSDNSKCLARDLNACKFTLALLHLLCHILGQGVCPFYAANDVSGREHKSANNKLLNRVCIRSRRVEHDDTVLGASVYRDVVYSRACSCDSAKLGVEFHIEHIRRANHNSIGRLYVLAYVEKLSVKLVCTDLCNFVE